MAELDPAGGTIAARQLVHHPGLLALAAAGSHQLTESLVLDHLQQLTGGPPVLLAPPGPDRPAAALSAVTRAGLLPLLRGLPGFDIVADCGRIDGRSPARAVLDEADFTVFVVRPTTQDVIGLEHRLQTLAPDVARSGLLVIGSRPYPADEVARLTGLPLVGTLDHDERAANRLADGLGAGRSGLQRSAAGIADRLVRHLPDPPPVTSDIRACASATSSGARPGPAHVAPSATPPPPARFP